ncbi:hypothetical protein AMB3_1457 [plant metagenome]
MGRGHLGIRHQAELTSTRSLSAACWPASAGLFFCRRAAPRQKAAPSGGSKPKARRGGLFVAGPPQDKKRPPRGAASRRRGVGAFLPPGRPKTKSAQCEGMPARRPALSYESW